MLSNVLPEALPVVVLLPEMISDPKVPLVVVDHRVVSPTQDLAGACAFVRVDPNPRAPSGSRRIHLPAETPHGRRSVRPRSSGLLRSNAAPGHDTKRRIRRRRFSQDDNSRRTASHRSRKRIRRSFRASAPCLRRGSGHTAPEERATPRFRCALRSGPCSTTLIGIPGSDCTGLVVRVVVHDDDLHRRTGLGANRSQKALQRRGRVPRRHNDTYERIAHSGHRLRARGRGTKRQVHRAESNVWLTALIFRSERRSGTGNRGQHRVLCAKWQRPLNP